MQSLSIQGKGKDSGKCAVLFHSTSAAIRAETILKDSGMKVKVIPVPRHLSSDCGICLCFDPRRRKKVEDALEANKVDYQSIDTI